MLLRTQATGLGYKAHNICFVNSFARLLISWRVLEIAFFVDFWKEWRIGILFENSWLDWASTVSYDVQVRDQICVNAINKKILINMLPSRDQIFQVRAFLIMVTVKATPPGVTTQGNGDDTRSSYKTCSWTKPKVQRSSSVLQEALWS